MTALDGNNQPDMSLEEEQQDVEGQITTPFIDRDFNQLTMTNADRVSLFENLFF